MNFITPSQLRPGMTVLKWDERKRRYVTDCVLKKFIGTASRFTDMSFQTQDGKCVTWHGNCTEIPVS